MVRPRDGLLIKHRESKWATHKGLTVRYPSGLGYMRQRLELVFYARRHAPIGILPRSQQFHGEMSTRVTGTNTGLMFGYTPRNVGGDARVERITVAV